MNVDRLREPITDEASLYELGVERRYAISPLTGESTVLPWWLHREYLRIENGIYITTEVLSKVNEHNVLLAAHVSTDDNGLVAYTHDAEAGRRDKQVKIAIGRFLTKFYPWLPDHTIANLAADHAAEVNLEVEFITGPAIADAYDAGIDTCMSKKGWRPEHRPTLAYDAPNMALAVLRDRQGKINARAMVYTPSPEDKRIIRAYGDPKLPKKLKALGFKIGTWIGAKFRTIEKSEGVYVMPYLDGNGGAGSTSHSHVALIDGTITCVGLAQAKRISTFNSGAVVCSTNTAGQIHLQGINSEEFIITCCVTGEKVNQLTETRDLYKVVTSNGLGWAVNIPPGARQVRFSDETSPHWQAVYALSDTPTVHHSYYEYYDSPHIRTRLGYRLLSEKYYPANRWSTTAVRLGSTDSFIEREDSVSVVSEGGVVLYYHQNELDGDWVKVHSPTKGERVYAKSGDFVVRTNTGRKVIPAYHAVVKTWDGHWAFTKSVSSYTLFGNESVYYVKGQKPTLTSSSSYVQEAFERVVQYYLDSGAFSETDDWLMQVITACVNASSTYLYIGERSIYGPYWESKNVTAQQVWEALQATPLFIVKVAKVWLENKLAEANAIEYPHRHDEPVTLVVEAAETPETQPELETV